MKDENWQLGESLDALDDLLYGGFGAAKDLKEYKLIWKDASVSREKLGIEATKEWYSKKLGNKFFNQENITRSLQELNAGKGKTYFDLLVEIIGDHKNITLELQA